MDLILRNARLPGAETELVDIGILDGLVAAIQPGLPPVRKEIHLEGKLTFPGFVETHIHLDKTDILDRCESIRGSLDEAIEQVARAKASFTEEDVADRASRTLEKCIKGGTGYMRTQVEVDPMVGLRGLRGVQHAIKRYDWAIDVEICVFPQEGLLSYPGTEELLIESLRSGVKVIGGAPYTDVNPHGQIDRIFEIAREYDVDIDMHLDFSCDPSNLDALYVCDKTIEYGWSGRVTIGHVTKLAALNPGERGRIAKRLADAGISLTVMPATDLFLMGRDTTENVPRGLAPAHTLMEHGVTCSISTNNVLNPFTPFGDGSLTRMANLYANACQVGTKVGLENCFKMITSQAAAVMNLSNYNLSVGSPADIVVLNCKETAGAVAEIARPVFCYKAGKQVLHRPIPELGGGGC